MHDVLGAGFYRPSDFEVATGHVGGFDHRPAGPPASRPAPTPRAGFEAALLPALLRPPCVVAFSGGRDSSAVLAVATHVARREGLPDPIPATHDFDGRGDTDERRFQELLVRRLGLGEWTRVRDEGGFEILGERARRRLQSSGVVWPALLHVHDPLVELAAGGGSFVVGEGGDEVFGDHRMALARLAVRDRRRPDLRALAGTLAPAVLRRRRLHREVCHDDLFPWLPPAMAERAVRVLVRDAETRPLLWGESVRRQGRRRAATLTSANFRHLLRARDVAYHEPFLDPAFVEPLARAGGWRGWQGRTTMMRTFFGDVVPDEICTRTQKATFNAVAVGEDTRAFLAGWTGEGVDQNTVDAEALRAALTAEQASRFGFLLIQRAWLAVQRPSSVSTS